MLSTTLNAENSEEQADSQVEVIRGLIKPTTSAVISSETSAQIEELAYKSGDAFKKGDVLVRFNCGLFAAQQASIRAVLEGKKKSLENLKRLLALNASSDVDVELAEIEVSKAQADLKVATIMVSRCTIKAPYDGRVINSQVNRYESVTEGQELLEILNDKQLEIEVIVPSSWLVWMQKGLTFEIHIDDIQARFEAKVVQIGATVDPVSQTISIKGVFTEQANVLAGMSGSAYFSPAK
jgi:RND family efflux transporter MFP subunit